MSSIRRFLGFPPKRPTIDLEFHDEIIHNLEEVIVKLKAGDPLTRMVRGTWRAADSDESVDMDLDLSEHKVVDA